MTLGRVLIRGSAAGSVSAFIGVAMTAEVGNRLGVATLLMLISLVGGRTAPWQERQENGHEQTLQNSSTPVATSSILATLPVCS